MDEDNEYRLGLFGPKNAGKTVYLATLYSHGDNDKISTDLGSVHVSASDDPSDETHTYLSKSIDQLKGGLWPDATAFEELRAIRFRITSSGTQVRVNIPDVAGEVTRRNTVDPDRDSHNDSSTDDISKVDEPETNPKRVTQESELKKLILGEFSNFDGFLIFAPADGPGRNKSLEFKWEVDALLEALKERSKDGKIRRPIAVVISKWDVLCQTADTPSEQNERALDFLKANYPETVNALEATCEKWKVFPVSSTGPTLNGDPPAELQPSGMMAPVMWLLRTGERTSFARAVAFEEKHASNLFSTVDDGTKKTYLQKSLGRYQLILGKSPPPEIRSKVEDAIQTLNQKAARRRRTRIYKRVVAVTVAVVFIWSLWDGLIYKGETKSLNDSPLTQEPLKRIIESAEGYCDSNWHWLAEVYGWKRDLRTLTRERKSAWKYKWILKLRKDNYYSQKTRIQITPPTDITGTMVVAKATEFIANCKDFEGIFENESDAEDVKGWREDAENWLITKRGTQEAERLLLSIEDQDKLNLEQLKQWIDDAKAWVNDDLNLNISLYGEVRSNLVKREAEFADRISDTEWLAFRVKYSELSDQPWEQYLAANSWHAKNPETAHEDEIVGMKRESLMNADNKAWNELQQYKTSNRTNHKRTVEMATDYLDHSEFKLHVDEGKIFLTSEYDSWDKQLYKDITDEADVTLDGNQLAQIKYRCDEYLSGTGRPVAMRADVDKWLVWHARLRSRVTYAVTLVSVTIKKDSKWDSIFYNPDVKVTVKVGKTARSSGVKEMRIFGEPILGFPDKELSGFVWSQGDQDIQVSITCDDYNAETFTAKLIPDKTFMIRHLNGTVIFDGGKILVELECKAVEPPRLPPYRSVN